MVDDDVFLQFERALFPNGKTLVPRMVLFPKKIKELSDQEKKEMINLLEHAKEYFQMLTEEQKKAIIDVGKACRVRCMLGTLKYVYSDGEFVYGTNGHIMLVAKVAVPKRFYEPNGNPTERVFKPLPYREVIPDYKTYIQPLHSRSKFVQKRNGHVKADIFKNSAGEEYLAIQTRLVMKAKAFVGNDFKLFSDPESGREPVVFEGKDRLAVVMPMTF